MTTHATSNKTSVNLEQALFEGQFQYLVATLYENERPPCGLAGALDWYTHGLVSRHLRSGVLTGQVGECAYLPFSRFNSTFHLILVGAGKSKKPGHRGSLDQKPLEILRKNLASLKIASVGISRSDFGEEQDSSLSKLFKGIPLWIGP